MIVWLWYYVLPGARKRREALLGATCGDDDCWICNFGQGGVPT